jgi:NAD(P)H-hydrate epimerase
VRHPDSHKGDNGTVAIIGGSRTMHGAPIFSALAAEATGVDLVHLCVPALHATVARTYSLNVQVHPFHGVELQPQDRRDILALLATMDCAVIGPGIGREEKTLAVLRDVIAESSCGMILDASALQPWTLKASAGKQVIVTPHLGELERMGVAPDQISDYAKRFGITIVVKGVIDRIALPDGHVHEVSGGNAGLTVGGTGDALAGMIAGLTAQGLSPLEACTRASTILKRAGAVLYPEFGYAYGTRRVIEQIPAMLRTME